LQILKLLKSHLLLLKSSGSNLFELKNLKEFQRPLALSLERGSLLNFTVTLDSLLPQFSLLMISDY